MKVQNNVRQLIFSLLFLTGSAALGAESFRVSKVHIAEISQTPNTEVVVKPGINDSVAVKLPENQEYLEGLEFKFTIPESVAYWMDSVACSVYADIKPIPNSSQIDYSGSKVFVRTLPNKLSWVLQVPLKEGTSLKTNNYTQTIDKVVTPADNYLFIRLQPVMKGIPDETLEAIIPISIKPILANKGKLKLILTAPEGTDLQQSSVFVDDEIVSFSNDGELLLETGIHNISIISEAYRNEMRTVRIEQASETSINVQLRSIQPTLLITAPEGTTVTLDNEQCNSIGEEFEITEGEHIIKFTIGDYEMIRTIDAIKGKTYKADFSLDLKITEE